MAVAVYGVGVYGTDTYGELPGVTVPVRERPPLRVTMDIETPGGKHYRWAEDEPAPENVPSGLRWSDTMPGGFESLDCTLPRKPGIDYSDLEQLSTIRVLGASGDIAGEYRLERSPRTSGDQVAISPGAVGWQAHLEDDKSASMIYVDRDLTRWGSMGAARRATILASGSGAQPVDPSVVPDPTSGMPGVLMEFDGDWAVNKEPTCEALYDAGAGNLIASIFVDWLRNSNSSSTSFVWRIGVADTDVLGGFTTTGDLQSEPSVSDDTVYTPAVARRFGYLNFNYSVVGAVTSPGTRFGVTWRRVAVYGDHGLTFRAISASEPWGYYASDVVAHAVGQWASLLNVTGESVQPSSFAIPHLAFPEPTTAGEIIRQATRFGLQDWAVWDNKTFWWHERGAFSKLWRTRVAPAQLDETGPQVDRLWESVIVQYQDVDGSTKTVGPPGSGADTEDALLKDTDPDNPANQLGIIRRDILQMGTSTVAGATEIGRRFLEEARLLDRSGRARVVGHVEDSSGVMHPYWGPRAGDYISFIDAADTSYRRIVRTDKSHSDRTCSLDLDAPPEGLKALLERLGVVLVPLGLS